jgi:hypothetical protein
MKQEAGPGFSGELVSRALAAGDIDNDGDLDLLVTNNGAAANLLLNDPSTAVSTGARNAGNALVVRAIGTRSNRSALGARLVVTLGARRQSREIQSGSSYLGQSDLRAHFGLGPALRADRLEIVWPSGTRERFDNVAANQIVTLEEGKGIVGRMAFTH